MRLKPNITVLVACLAVQAVLVIGALRFGRPWSEPLLFALGVFAPAFTKTKP